MKALVLKTPGKYPEYQELADPIPDQKVVVDLKASALNHRDVWISKGLYPGISYPAILGSDGAGIYEGERVLINPSHNWGGDEAFQAAGYSILGLPDEGTFATKIAIDPKYIHKIPTHLGFEEAAALPLAGLTAFRALVSRGQAKGGERVFINGIGGGVALFSFQFAKSLGCTVYVSSGSEEKINKALELGAAGGISYKKENWSKEILGSSGKGFDIIIDGAGGEGFEHLVKIANPGARIVVYGGTRGAIKKLNTQQLFWKQISILGTTMGSPGDFGRMLELVNDKKIHPIIDCTLDLEQGHRGFSRMDEGLQFGKIVFKHP